MKYLLTKIISCIVLTAFVLTSVVPPSFAQGVITGLDLPPVGSMVQLSGSFEPAVLKGIKIDPNDPFRFEFLIGLGQTGLQGDGLKDESGKLIRYFLAAMTTSEKDLWVNLSPYENDRIIPQTFGMTEMGRDLLAEDYILKQITSSLMYPESEPGRTFWQEVYKQAYDRYGTTEVPLDTFNKVWITPDKAEVYEDKGVAFIGESHLKVMLESDYMAMDHNGVGAASGRPQEDQTTSEMTKEIIRNVMLPVIEKEVNEGRNFSQLRQIYQSLILAAWYKKRLKESVLSKVYVDQDKVEGIDIEDKDVKQKIYLQYIEAFKKGAYNYIKEEYDQYTQEPIPRKYFSGGFVARQWDKIISLRPLKLILAANKVLQVGALAAALCILSPSEGQAQGPLAGVQVGFEQNMFAGEPVNQVKVTIPLNKQQKKDTRPSSSSVSSKSVGERIGLVAANIGMGFLVNEMMGHIDGPANEGRFRQQLRLHYLQDVLTSAFIGGWGAEMNNRNILDGILLGGVAGNGMFLSKQLGASGLYNNNYFSSLAGKHLLYPLSASMQSNLWEGRGALSRVRTLIGPVELTFNFDKKVRLQGEGFQWRLDVLTATELLYQSGRSLFNQSYLDVKETLLSGTITFNANGSRPHAFGNIVVLNPEYSGTSYVSGNPLELNTKVHEDMHVYQYQAKPALAMFNNELLNLMVDFNFKRHPFGQLSPEAHELFQFGKDEVIKPGSWADKHLTGKYLSWLVIRYMYGGAFYGNKLGLEGAPQDFEGAPKIADKAQNSDTGHKPFWKRIFSKAEPSEPSALENVSWGRGVSGTFNRKEWDDINAVPQGQREWEQYVDFDNDVKPNITPSILAGQIKAIQGVSLKAGDIEAINVRYVASGIEKNVFMVEVKLVNGRRIKLALAGVKGGRAFQRMQDAVGKMAEKGWQKDLPALGEIFAKGSGKDIPSVYYTEWISGGTVGARGVLSENEIRAVVRAAMHVGKALNYPGDLHADNFMVRDGDVPGQGFSDVAVVDIGDIHIPTTPTRWIGLLVDSFSNGTLEGFKVVMEEIKASLTPGEFSQMLFESLLKKDFLFGNGYEMPMKTLGKLEDHVMKDFLLTETELTALLDAMAVERLVAQNMGSPAALNKDSLWSVVHNPKVQLETVRELLRARNEGIPMDQAHVKAFGILKDSSDASELGGIDFDPAKMNMSIKGDGSAAVNAFDPAIFEQLQNAPGFSPVILNISPVNDLPAFFGISS